MKRGRTGTVVRWLGETPGTELPGVRIIAELPSGLALPAWMTFRLVMLFAHDRIADPTRTDPPFDAGATIELVHDLRASSTAAPEGFCGCLAGVLAEMTAPEADVETLARGCLCAAEFAMGEAPPGPYTGTALAFVEAAAWASGSARYWFLAGKLHRHHGEHLKAEFFFTRAMELARGQGDYETVVRLRLARGNTLLSRGDYEGAKCEYEGALRSCVANRLRGSLKAEVHHDLMIVRTMLRDHARALDDAERAVVGYTGEDHPRTPFLVHDLAWLWIQMRDYRNAFAVLTELLEAHPSFASDPLSRMMVTANVLWAAAGAGAMEAYRRSAPAFSALLRETLAPAPTGTRLPPSLPHGGLCSREITTASPGGLRLPDRPARSSARRMSFAMRRS